MTTTTATKQADHYIVTAKPDGPVISEWDDMSDTIAYADHIGAQAWVVFTDGTEQRIN